MWESSESIYYFEDFIDLSSITFIAIYHYRLIILHFIPHNILDYRRVVEFVFVIILSILVLVQT